MLYANRFLKDVNIYMKLGVASFLPNVVVGFLAYHTIKQHLFNPLVVSVSLIAGGVVLDHPGQTYRCPENRIP